MSVRRLSPVTRVRIHGIAAAVAPVALVGALLFGAPAVRTLSGPPVQTVSVVLPSPADSVGSLTPEQVKAIEFALQASLAPLGESPFYIAPRRFQNVGPAEPAPQAEPRFGAAPKFALSSIMVGAKETFVVLNGKTHRLSDEVAPGWTLTMIDADAGSVVITDVEGRTLAAALKRPE